MFLHIIANGICPVNAGDGDGVGHTAVALRDAGIGETSAENEIACSALAPARDAGVRPGACANLEIDAHGDFGAGIHIRHFQCAFGGATIYGQIVHDGKTVVVARGGRVGAQGHAQRQDERQGKNSLLHGNLLLSQMIGWFF